MAYQIDSIAHVRNLVNSLNVQRKKGAFCDVLLKVSSGQTLPTHACVLTACSPYFEELICGEYGSGPPRMLGVPLEVVLDLPGLVAGEDSDPHKLDPVVSDLLDYIYTGKIDLRADSAGAVGRLADAFMLDGLSSLINEFVGNTKPAEATAAVPETPPRLRLLRDAAVKRRKRKLTPKKLTFAEGKGRTAGAEQSAAVTDGTVEPTVRVLRSRKRRLVSDDVVDEEVGASSAEEEEEDEEENRGDVVGTVDPSFVPADETSKSTSPRARRQRRTAKKCTFKCGECDFVSENQQAIRDHKRIHNRSRAYVCVSCGFFTGRCAVLLSHLTAANHPEKECSLCGFVAGDRATFRAHLARHQHRKLPFFCQLCDMRCRARSMLEKHVAKHAATRAFVCDICGNGFKLKQGLNTHMQTHTAAKNFSCNDCDFRTAYKTNLQMHVRKHNGSMFKCTQDGCTFMSNSKHNLQSHVLTHAKLKPYVCEVCGQKFAQERNLRRHSKIHDPEAKLMQCDICRQFTTTRRDRFSAHVKKCGTTSAPAGGMENHGSAAGGTKPARKNCYHRRGGESSGVAPVNDQATTGNSGSGLVPAGVTASVHHGGNDLAMVQATNEYSTMDTSKMCHGPPTLLHQPIATNAPHPPDHFDGKPMMDYQPRMYWFP